jgi:ubiquinone/menaquinone biosynthesis C-methylase UbiE
MHMSKHNHSGQDEHSAHKGHEAFANMPAWRYDLMTWFGFYGKERKSRQMTIDLIQLQPGEAVLDVGCGTGTLALVAKKRVGKTGRVCGVDPSASLLAGARRKAARARLPIDFQLGGIEQIPFPDQSFDAVLSTFMLHHLSDDLKRRGLTEIMRVLKPEGRLLVIDFKHPEEYQAQPEQFGGGEIDIQNLPAHLKEAGFSQVESEDIPFHTRSLSAGHKSPGFVLAKKSPTEYKIE